MREAAAALAAAEPVERPVGRALNRGRQAGGRSGRFGRDHRVRLVKACVFVARARALLGLRWCAMLVRVLRRECRTGGRGKEKRAERLRERGVALGRNQARWYRPRRVPSDRPIGG